MDATHAQGHPRVLISRSALLHNVKVLRRALRPGTKICAMIKADAYGHSASIVADTLANFSHDGLEAPAVDCLAVATIEEAAALPRPSVPLMVLRPVENVYLARQRPLIEHALRNNWILTLASPAAASDIARLAISTNQLASVQIMLDTGICREGAPLDSLPDLLTAIRSHPSLRLHALCTHFVSSEEPANLLTLDQLRRFTLATASCINDHPKLIRHAANSAAIFFAPSSHLDMVRPGLSLYGLDPTGLPDCSRPLRPVLKWTAPIFSIRNLPPGTAVGYNHTWRAPANARIGLVPVGYADGYLRAFSNRASMLVHGHPVPVVGRVSMDYTTIDLTNVPHANVGDEVTLLDSDPLSPASAYALARTAQTIPYEILSRIGPRMPRIAIDSTPTPLVQRACETA